jgi:tetratricopeptide (TPR) repeat protein
MILNYDHYHAGRKRRTGVRLIPVFAGLAAAAIVLVIVLGIPQKLLPASGARAGAGKLPELWKSERYDAVVSTADAVLKSDPLNPAALAYRGFASFYRAVSEVSPEEKIPYLDDAIVSLRRARLAGSTLTGETDYILAKAYFHKGKYYYDLSIGFMQSAVARGFIQMDSYEYLGLAYSQLGDYDKGIAYFLEALKQEPSDLLLLTIGQTYYQMKHTGEAVDYLLRALNKTEDKAIEKRARFLLGEIYLDRNEVFKAEEQYSSLVRLDPQSADAHFFLGEVYAKMNDRVKARAEWRTAFSLDQTHYGAKLRLFK